MGSEKGSDFYKVNDRYRTSWQESKYRELWGVVKQLVGGTEQKILDLGCGAGQFAEFMYEMRYKHYKGIDFSRNAIEVAKGRELNYVDKQDYEFILDNFFLNAPLMERLLEWCDVVVILETLEHVNGDLILLDMIPSGKRCVISVPNFDSESHVRVFSDLSEVVVRYEPKISFQTLGTWDTPGKNKIFYGLGVKK